MCIRDRARAVRRITSFPHSFINCLAPGSFTFAFSFRKLRLTAETVFTSPFPCAARIFSRPALSLLPFLSGSCGLPPRPCSQASFPARHGFSPTRLFHFCLFFPEVAAYRRDRVHKPVSLHGTDFLPPGSFTFAFSFQKLRLGTGAILANRILRPARVLYHPAFPILSLAGSFCRSFFHAANHLSGPGLCVFCSWYTFSISVFAQFHNTRSAFVSLPRETGCRNCISAWKMGLFLLVSGDEARLLSQLLFSFFFKPGDQRLCDFPSRSFLYCAGPFPLFPQNSAVALFLFLTYGPRRGKIPIAAVCLPAFPTRLCRQPYLCFSLMAPRRGEAA